MMVKIDHVAFGSSQFDADIRRFEQAGYALAFRETGLADLKNKRPLLQRFTGHLDMALLSRPGAISIEVINHDHTFAHPTWIYPVRDGARLDEGKEVERFHHGSSTYVKCQTPTEAFFSRNGSAKSGDTLVVETPDLTGACAFWEAFGFRRIGEKSEGAEMEFRSFLSRTATGLILRPLTTPPSRFWLDTQGFNCLAFFSSDPVKDRSLLAQRGFEVSEAEPLQVNGKLLTIFWVHGPGSEIVEVIGLAKR